MPLCCFFEFLLQITTLWCPIRRSASGSLMWMTILPSWPRRTKPLYVKMPNRDRYLISLMTCISTSISIMDHLFYVTAHLHQQQHEENMSFYLLTSLKEKSKLSGDHATLSSHLSMYYQCSAQVYSAMGSNYNMTDLALHGNHIQINSENKCHWILMEINNE